jgi:hypothetical protein
MPLSLAERLVHRLLDPGAWFPPIVVKYYLAARQ